MAKYRSVFDAPMGREVLADILDHCGVGRELWAVDQLQQNANLVRHDVGIYIKGMANETD